MPFLYAFIGGAGVVIFWRGVWHTMDAFMTFLVAKLPSSGVESIDLGALPWWDGLLSLLIGSVMLLISGAFVSSFIGNELILTGLRGEKKLTEKTELEVKAEASVIEEMRKKISLLSEHVDELEEVLEKKAK